MPLPKYCVLFLVVLCLCTGCARYTTKHYNLDFYQVAVPVKNVVYQGHYLHSQGTARLYPTIKADTSRAGRWTFYAQPVNKYIIRVRKTKEHLTTVAVRAHFFLTGLQRLPLAEAELMREIDSCISLGH